MILTHLDGVVAYRMHTPKWGNEPLSGAGAAAHGGRVNRPGVPALYLALDSDTAIREYQQLSRLMPPGLLVNYEITADQIVDFQHGYRPAQWAPIWEDFTCDWRTLWFGKSIEPPSWVIGDEVLAAGGKGILFRSEARPGGINLVLYPDALTATDKVTVFDPNHDLPKNQDSWK